MKGLAADALLVGCSLPLVSVLLLLLLLLLLLVLGPSRASSKFVISWTADSCINRNTAACHD
jgi:hypothetical protein